VGKRRTAHVSQVLVWRQVGYFSHVMGKIEKLRQISIRYAGNAELQFQVRDDRTQVRVAAALAVPINGALHLDAALAHGRQRVSHSAFAVVMGMDAEGCPILPG